MASGAQQLIEDFKQVQKLLEIYPNIKIIKTEGDPPEQYDIEYTIKGYKTNDDGTATPDNNHQVHITLPFGYPHFPPTAKPITPIFHPDIDPDAIRIADFWQENHSLADLIIHIGQMICGNHSTSEEPFNQSAFDWFEERKSWLPFDILEPQDEDETAENLQAAVSDEIPSETDQTQSTAATIDLDILKDDIDFPFDEEEEPVEDKDAFSFEIEDEPELDELSDPGTNETAAEPSLDDFDFGEQDTGEPFSLEEAEEPAEETSSSDAADPDGIPDNVEDEIDDLFSLDSGEDSDEFLFDFADETDTTESLDVAPSSTNDLSDQAIENNVTETSDEPLEFDMGELDSDEPFDLQETEEVISMESGEPAQKSSAADAEDSFELPENAGDEIDDLFSLDSDEDSDELSFDLTGETDTDESIDIEPSTENDLFDLATESDAAETSKGPLEIVSEDITTAFEEEADVLSTANEAVDIGLNELAGLEEETDTLDLGIDDESFDIGGEATVDLSGLEEEIPEDPGEINEDAFELGESAGDEEKILSALSLDEDQSTEENAEEQAGAIHSLIEQKQIFSAKKTLAELPDSLPGRKELELTIDDAVSEAEDLFKKSDKHEQKGEYEKAGILLDLVANISVDFPGLDFARNRIRESIMGERKKQPGEKAPDEKAVEPSEVKETDKKKPEPKKSRAKRSFKVPARLVAILLVIIVLAVLGAGGAYIYSNDSQNAHLARTAFQKAEQLIDGKEFKNAQNELNAARSALEKILFVHGTEKETITKKIAAITDSSLFKEGLKGRVLYGDKYVSVETAKAIDKFNTHSSYASQVQQAGKLEQAIAAYEKSLAYADKAGFSDQIAPINKKIVDMRLELLMNQAKKSTDEKDWRGAEKSYKTALELSKSISNPEVQKEISDLKALSSYQYGLQEGLKAISDSQWQRSIDAFQEVKKAITENPQIISDAEKTEIDKLLVQSRLYFRLSQAKIAYETKEWSLAINTYKDAIALLESNSTLLGKEGKENIKKIKKTILTTHVAREQMHIISTKAEKDLEKTVEHYENIINLIDKSEFKDGETLAKILDDARVKTAELKKELLISKRETWLLDNYEKIFRDNYPSAKQSELLKPKTRFIRRENNIMIFNISCTEKKQGRSFRLELNYQYDLNRDSWKLFAGSIEDE